MVMCIRCSVSNKLALQSATFLFKHTNVYIKHRVRLHQNIDNMYYLVLYTFFSQQKTLEITYFVMCTLMHNYDNDYM